MAKGFHPFSIEAGFPDSSGPSLFTPSGEERSAWSFDSATIETVEWEIVLPSEYDGTPELLILWSGSTSTTTSHTARWGAQLWFETPETDTTNMNTSSSFDTLNELDDDILGTNAGRLQLATMTLTNFDSGAAGDAGYLRFSRQASHANDDLPEDARLWFLALQYNLTAL